MDCYSSQFTACSFLSPSCHSRHSAMCMSNKLKSRDGLPCQQHLCFSAAALRSASDACLSSLGYTDRCPCMSEFWHQPQRLHDMGFIAGRARQSAWSYSKEEAPPTQQNPPQKPLWPVTVCRAVSSKGIAVHVCVLVTHLRRHCLQIHHADQHLECMSLP